MRHLTAITVALALLFATAPVASAAAPTIELESQAWWRRAGIVIPSAVGSHVHVRATVPQDGYPVTGTISIPIRITLHDAAGRTNWFRMGTESTELFKTDVRLGPCSDCFVDLTAVIDLGRVSTGRHELRMSANIPDEDPGLSGSQRMYQSTGFGLCVRACTPSYRSGPHTEARGWYTNRGYANAKVESDLSTVRSGGTIKVRLSPGSGGLATKFAGIYIAPSFHDGISGTVVRTWTAGFRGSVTLPTVAPGAHRLVLVSSDGLNAGVLVVPFTVPP